MKYLILTIAMLGATLHLWAQCSTCTPIDCSAQLPAGGLCDTIITGMANHPMSESVSFYMPKVVYNAQAPGGYVRLRRIKVTGVTGLPVGLSWQTNHAPSDEYFPASGDTTGCVTICGTPLQSGSFPLIVYLEADVTVISLNIDVNNQSQTYNTATVVILTDTSGGVASFSITPNITKSCDPLTLAFEAKIDGAPNPTTYDWDFGNGNTATGKNPGSQTYSDTGDYPIRLTTSIYNYVITEVRVFDVNNSYANDIEEATTLQSPDLYFTLPVLGYRSTSGSNSRSGTWSGLNIEIPPGTNEIELRVWDEDNGLPFGSQDDSLARVTINVARGTFLWDDAVVTSGVHTNGVIVIDTVLGNYFDETLNVTVSSYPEANLTTSKGDSICGGDTTVLTLSGSDIFHYEWYKDSVFLANVTDTFIPITASGVYWAEVFNSSGCKTVTDPRNVQVIPVPPVLPVYFDQALNKLYTIWNGGTYFQWFLNGTAIPNANSSYYIAQDTGHYQVEYSNVLGCTNRSSVRQVSVITSVSVKDIAQGMDAYVYPNPNDGRFMIQLQMNSPEDVDIMLTDNEGKEIYHATESMHTSVYTQEFDFGNLPSGIYFLKIRSAKSQLTKKILLAD